MMKLTSVLVTAVVAVVSEVVAVVVVAVAVVAVVAVDAVVNTVAVVVVVAVFAVFTVVFCCCLLAIQDNCFYDLQLDRATAETARGAKNRFYVGGAEKQAIKPQRAECRNTWRIVCDLLKPENGGNGQMIAWCFSIVCTRCFGVAPLPTTAAADVRSSGKVVT